MTSPFVPDIALVFAAGLGTRMRPITLTCPKPLVKIAGKTLIDRCLDLFAQAGVSRAIVNVHWLADYVEGHVVKRPSLPRIFLSDERPLLLGQGGAIRKNLALLGQDPFWICNTDSFWNEREERTLFHLAQSWDSEKMDMLLLLAPRETSIGVEGSGDFNLSSSGQLSLPSPATPASYVYTGVGLLSPSLFHNETREVFGLSPFFNEVARKGRLYGHVLTPQWFHIGTPKALEHATHILASQSQKL